MYDPNDVVAILQAELRRLKEWVGSNVSVFRMFRARFWKAHIDEHCEAHLSGGLKCDDTANHFYFFTFRKGRTRYFVFGAVFFFFFLPLSGWHLCPRISSGPRAGLLWSWWFPGDKRAEALPVP